MAWNTSLDLADLFEPYRSQPAADVPIDTFEPFRDAVVQRLRDASFYSDDDLTLRGFVNDLAKAHTPEQFNKEWGYIATWGDQEHVRVNFRVY